LCQSLTCSFGHTLLHCTLQEYLALFEGTLEEFIEREGATQEEFYAAIRDNQDSRDPGIKLFVTCLLASADYDSFFKVMVKVGSAALAVLYSCTIAHVHYGYIITPQSSQ
jgi:The ARF-like 2 binding protein BART